MHEAGIAMSVLETALSTAREARAREVLRVELRVGVLAGVVPDALRFAFDALKRGTAAERAELAIESVPFDAICPNCGLEFRVDGEVAVAICPTCDLPSATLARGDELTVAAVEVA